ncbi:MAG TPA: DUF167 domain-containing protein [Acidimicrobiales bacterium]|jgi:hypothetical protein|nr:DUF167 domain-containing protein [Acidimicrobiales bacterium]|tara:strand:- start:46 stop:306 length:261 start_codon:yes stop_codon:yes gene_type:complete
MSCILEALVSPRSSQNDVRYAHGVIKIRVNEAPVNGRATEAACKELAKALGLKRAGISVLTGATARTKRFQIEGLSELEALSRLGR